MKGKLVSIAFLTFLSLSSIVFYILALLIWLTTVLFDKRLVWLHLFTCFWGSLYLWIMPPWSVTVLGRDKLKSYWHTPCVLVSNHQSALDILVAFTLFFPFKWVSKAEMFKAPFVGWNMALNRYIRLKRGDKESGKKMLAECENALQQGCSVYLFPEGTRSQTGHMKDFKPGAFLLAHSAKVPIIPIAIRGTQNALPKKSLGFHGFHPITIEVLDAVPYADFAELSVEATAQKIKNILALALGQDTVLSAQPMYAVNPGET